MEPITREEQLMAAAAGQAVKLPEPITRREKFLKAIAERGGRAQPDMAQNDPTKADYVKNRTHYDSRQPGEVKITFDGDWDNYEHLWVDGGVGAGTCLVKVSDLTPTQEELVGGNFVMAGKGPDGEQTESQPIVDDSFDYDGAILLLNGGSVEILPADNEFRTKGIWFTYVDFGVAAGYPSELTFTGTVGELKKLDEKYLPDSVENRTYWFAGYRDGEEYVLHEGSYAEFMEGLGKGWFTAKVLDESGAIPVIFPISEIYDSSEFGEVLSFQRTYFNRDELKLVCDAIEIADSFAKYTTLYPIGGGEPG